MFSTTRPKNNMFFAGVLFPAKGAGPLGFLFSKVPEESIRQMGEKKSEVQVYDLILEKRAEAKRDLVSQAGRSGNPYRENHFFAGAPIFKMGMGEDLFEETMSKLYPTNMSTCEPPIRSTNSESDKETSRDIFPHTNHSTNPKHHFKRS